MSSNPPRSVKAAKLSVSSHQRLPMPNLDQLLDDTSGRVSWNEMLAILAHQSSTNVMREEPARSDATPALAKCDFDISTLVTVTREPPQVPQSLLEMTMPDEGYRIGTEYRAATVFDTAEASLQYHVQSIVEWLGTILLKWVGLKSPRFRIKVIPEVLGGGQKTLLCSLVERDDFEGRTQTNIGSIVVKSPLDDGIDSAKPTDIDLRGRLCRSAMNTEYRYTCLVAPPVLFNIARLQPFFKDDRHPKFKGLLMGANTCLDTPIDAEPDVIMDPARWLRFYESLLNFLILGLTQYSLKFRNCLEAKFTEVALHNDFARFLEEAEEFFASGKIDPYPHSSLGSLLLPVSDFIGSVARSLVKYLLPFLSSFRPHPNFSVLTVDAPTHAPRYLHLDLHPGQLLIRSQALIFIYEGQGIVVKTFTDLKQYQNEFSVYSVFSGQQGFPTLLAHGRSPPFILITYGGVSPPELSPVQLAFMRENIIAPMHAAGWHHHDLAERNVVVDMFGNVTLIDFQFATQDCVGGNICPDNDFLQFHGLLPISPANVPSDL